MQTLAWIEPITSPPKFGTRASSSTFTLCLDSVPTAEVLVVDEADLTLSDALRAEDDIAARVFAAAPAECARLIVGATLDEPLIAGSVERGWLRPPVIRLAN